MWTNQNSFIIAVLEFESLYIENLPSSETYEFSYMHRDVVTHIVVTKTDFVITASQDGHLKFWKKQVKHGTLMLLKLVYQFAICLY